MRLYKEIEPSTMYTDDGNYELPVIVLEEVTEDDRNILQILGYRQVRDDRFGEPGNPYEVWTLNSLRKV